MHWRKESDVRKGKIIVAMTNWTYMHIYRNTYVVYALCTPHNEPHMLYINKFIIKQLQTARTFFLHLKYFFKR